MTRLSIDNQSYDIENLSPEAQRELAHIRFIDAEIQRLQLSLAVHQTARTAYVAALKDLLPKPGFDLY